MASTFALSLEELPDLAELNRSKQALEDKLCEAGNNLACKHWGLFDDSILAALSKALRGLDLVWVIARAWSAAIEVRQLGRDTAKDGSTRKLKLGHHPLTVDLHPVVTVNVAAAPLPELRFTLRLEADIAWAVLLITNGVLTSIEKASLTINVTLLYDTVVLKGPLSKEWSLLEPHAFADGGYRLVEPVSTPAAVPPLPLAP